MPHGQRPPEGALERSVNLRGQKNREHSDRAEARQRSHSLREVESGRIGPTLGRLYVVNRRKWTRDVSALHPGRNQREDVPISLALLSAHGSRGKVNPLVLI